MTQTNITKKIEEEMTNQPLSEKENKKRIREVADKEWECHRIGYPKNTIYMKKQRHIRNDPFGWDFQDHLEILLNPKSKLQAIGNFVFTWLLFIPIIFYIFLSFFICGIIGLFFNSRRGILK